MLDLNKQYACVRSPLSVKDKEKRYFSWVWDVGLPVTIMVVIFSYFSLKQEVKIRKIYVPLLLVILRYREQNISSK